ncbi:MAG TPA: LD-carboxypeptidase [Patescibacteria group bacterium]|nr:LD-carboxypeptidase [Patescibacteria group bacterium]
MIKPARLKHGDTLGIVAPASAPANPANIDLGLKAIEQLGFKAKPATNLRRRWGFLAGSDRERAADIMEMFQDRQVNGIICLRGGYGAARLLPLLDYQVIRANPKVFVGYSDITSLHCAFLARAELVSFHGPMLNSDFLKEKVPDFTTQSFFRTVMEVSAPGNLNQGYRKNTVKVLSHGKASGPLVGGNISILCAALATPYQPSFEGVILFIEDLNEEPYRFDRMLTQLLNGGLLQKVAGVAVGVNKNCRDRKAKKGGEYRQSLEDVLRDRLLPLKVPVITGLPFGHVRHNATLPIGVRASLDTEKGELSILEPAVE